MNRNQAITLVLLAMLWGASFLFMRIAAPVLGAVWLIELRVLIAGLVFLPILAYRQQLRPLLEQARGLFIIGLLNAALPFTLLAYATIELTAGLTSILNATVPIFSALFAYLVMKEHLSWDRVVGIAMGFFGVILLVFWREQGEIPLASLISTAAALLATLSYVLAANYTRYRLPQVPPLVFVAGSQLSAALILLPLLPFYLPVAWPDGDVILSVIGLALFSTALAFVYYFKLLHEIGPTKTLTVTYLIPIFAILWGNLFLDEAITLVMLSGCLLIIIGTALANQLRLHKLRGPRQTDKQSPR